MKTQKRIYNFQAPNAILASKWIDEIQSSIQWDPRAGTQVSSLLDHVTGKIWLKSYDCCTLYFPFSVKEVVVGSLCPPALSGGLVLLAEV